MFAVIAGLLCPMCVCTAAWAQEAHDTAQVHLSVAQIRKRSVFDAASYVNKMLLDVHPDVAAYLQQSAIAMHMGKPVAPFENRYEALVFWQTTWRRLQKDGLLPDSAGFTGVAMNGLVETMPCGLHCLCNLRTRAELAALPV